MYIYIYIKEPNLVNQSITIFRDINVICRVANSTKLIDVPKFKEFCKEAYIFKVKSFKWASLPVTQHRGYGHLANVIQLNDCRGLGDVSESGLGWEKSSALEIYTYIFMSKT